MRRTKIVCTIGPASDSPEILERLIESGMNVARLNFSHGNHDEHGSRIQLIRRISKKLNLPVAVLQDLSGPKIRLGEIGKGEIHLKPKDEFTLTNRNVSGNEREVSVSYPDLPKEVKIGDTLLLSDGRIELKVKHKDDRDIKCEVIVGGKLSSHKGINLPTGTINMPALTKKDRIDLAFGIENAVDYVALSFVKKAEDIKLAKALIEEKGSDIPVIAKIEKHEALQNIDEIIEGADGIMVARGDLGVEIPVEKIALTQKLLIRKSNSAGIPVITATQMLHSMEHSSRPTRAEATDVANAILDGTDAVMLSEETAIGSYPVESVQMMAKIAGDAESALNFHSSRHEQDTNRKSVPDAVSHATCTTADDLHAAAIVTCTHSGSTARLIAKYRPRQPIVAPTPNIKTYRRLALVWGVLPVMIGPIRTTDEIVETATRAVLVSGFARKSETVVITAGIPIGLPGTTNLIRVETIE